MDGARAGACMTVFPNMSLRIRRCITAIGRVPVSEKRVLLDKKKKKDGNRANFSRGWQATPFLPGEVMIDVLTPGCVSAGLGQASGRSGDLACLRCVCGSGGGGVRGLYDTEA